MKKSKLKFIKRYVEVKRGHQLIHEGLQVPLEQSREQYLHITHACQHVHTYIYAYTQYIHTTNVRHTYVGRWWLIGRVDAFRPKGHGFDSRSNRHVGTLGKSFTHSCQWRSGVKFRHSVRDVSGASLSSSWLEEAL